MLMLFDQKYNTGLQKPFFRSPLQNKTPRALENVDFTRIGNNKNSGQF